MINVLICGITGETGKRVYLTAKKYPKLNVVCGVDTNFNSNIEFDCPVYSSFDQVKEMVDVIINFSTPDALCGMLDFALENNTAIVEGTTGYTAKQIEQIYSASKQIAIFTPAQVSPGIKALNQIATACTQTLANFDIEIIEELPVTELNAPCALATLIAESIAKNFGDKKVVFGRKGNVARGEEICIHSVRGGNASGKITVKFIGEHECITLTHEVYHRTLYAMDACEATEFICQKSAGIYNIQNFNKI